MREAFEKELKILNKKNLYDPDNPSHEANNIYEFGGHPRVDQYRPVILDAKKPMYVRTIHSAGDSFNKKTRERFMSTDDVSEEVRKTFNSITFR